MIYGYGILLLLYDIMDILLSFSSVLSDTGSWYLEPKSWFIRQKHTIEQKQCPQFVTIGAVNNSPHIVHRNASSSPRKPGATSFEGKSVGSGTLLSSASVILLDI